MLEDSEREVWVLCKFLRQNGAYKSSKMNGVSTCGCSVLQITWPLKLTNKNLMALNHLVNPPHSKLEGNPRTSLLYALVVLMSKLSLTCSDNYQPVYYL
jgi:hypothetical protein